MPVPLHNNICSKRYTGACTSSLRTCIYHSYGDVFNEEGVFSPRANTRRFFFQAGEGMNVYSCCNVRDKLFLWTGHKIRCNYKWIIRTNRVWGLIENMYILVDL